MGSQKANGTVQIWIHSHYDESTDQPEQAEHYKKVRTKALSSINPDAIPVISFRGFEILPSKVTHPEQL